jgi:hypothetical protein
VLPSITAAAGSSTASTRPPSAGRPFGRKRLTATAAPIARAVGGVAAAHREGALAALGPTVALTVVVTGNHYVFDIAAGLLVAGVGYLVGRVPERSRGRFGGSLGLEDLPQAGESPA